MTETRPSITISDRNLAAYLRAIGHSVDFIPRPAGHLDFSFLSTTQLTEDIEAFLKNPPVPVLNFLAAQRELTDAIRDHRQRRGARV